MNGESDIVMNIDFQMYSPETIDRKCYLGWGGAGGAVEGGCLGS